MTLSQKFSGCDVSRDHLDLCISCGDVSLVETRFDNSADGLEALASVLHKHQVETIVYEPSGGYECALGETLARHSITGCRVNARQVRDFAKSLGLFAKTDRVDARILARYGQMVRPRSHARPSPQTLELQALVRRRRQLVGARKKEKQHLAMCTHEVIRSDIEAEIVHLTKRIITIEKTIDDHIANHKPLADRAMLLASIPGIGKVSLATLIAEMPELGSITTKAAANLTGLAPHPRDSGLWRGKRTCWGGRKPVRDCLYMAALSASRTDPKLKAKYQAMKDRNKPHKLILIAIARNLIQIANTLIQKQETYKLNHSC